SLLHPIVGEHAEAQLSLRRRGRERPDRVSAAMMDCRCRAALLGMTLAILAPSADRAWAASATVTGTTAGESITIVPNGSVWAGAMTLHIDSGADTNGYCVDVTHPISIGDTVPQVPPAYPCQVLYILGHYFPSVVSYPGKLANNNDEGAAIQAAIWHFTD